jgi:hypothetical protein
MIRKTYLLSLLVLSILFTSNTAAQKGSEASFALWKVTARLEQNNSISYNITYKCKLLYSQKLASIQGKVDLIRSNNDVNFGGIFWYKVSDTLEKYYDGKTIYQINHKTKKITSQNPSEGDLDLITQELDGDVIRIPFVAPKSISGLINNENKLKLSTYKKIKNSQCVNVKYPNDARITDAEMDLVFDKTTFDILRIFSKMVFHSQSQSNEWIFSNIKYGEVTEKALKERFQKFNKYKFEKFQKPSHQFQNQ